MEDNKRMKMEKKFEILIALFDQLQYMKCPDYTGVGHYFIHLIGLYMKELH